MAMIQSKPGGQTKKNLYIKTYGCQMNVYDSERMRDILAPLGYQGVDSADKADLVILNTCHIREKASEKVYSELGQLKQLKVDRQANGIDMKLVVAGCVGQAEGAEIIRRQPAVNLVLGPQSYHQLPEMIGRAVRNLDQRLETDFAGEDKFDALPKKRRASGPSAFVSIQEGCNKFCTFCVVPYTRGAEFSRPVNDIMDEVTALAEQGVCEINLLGQNVNAYHGLAPDGNVEWGLADLLNHITRISGIKRLRYTTSHPRDMDNALIAAHGALDKLIPYLHLPAQSGSDRILKAMNRGHSAQRYLDIVDALRAIRPDIAMASDFIVGFPGETEGDFDATMDLVSTVNFAQAYSFKYSPRPGTPAATMSNQVDEGVKDVRLQKLQALLRTQQTAFNESKIGECLEVLVSGKGRKPGQIQGRSNYGQSVYFNGKVDMIGQNVNVEILSATQNSLSARLISPDEGAS